MQIKLFTVPINDVESYNEDLNKFLRSHKIVEIEKHLLQSGTTYSWCFCITYIGSEQMTRKEQKLPKKVKIDYMKVLDKPIFDKFSKLREIRKKIAAQNAVSAYIVFTDAELAEIAKLEEITLKRLKMIKGIGDKKADKYGKLLIEGYNKFKNETGRTSN